MGLVKPILYSLNDSDKVEYSFSEYGVKKEGTPLNIFKQFLNALPNRGMFDKNSEITADFDYDVAVEHFSQKLFNKKYSALSAKELKDVMSAMRKDPKASKLI